MRTQFRFDFGPESWTFPTGTLVSFPFLSNVSGWSLKGFRLYFGCRFRKCEWSFIRTSAAATFEWPPFWIAVPTEWQSWFFVFLKARPHCKSPGQIVGAARPSGLMSVDLSHSQFKLFFNSLPTFTIYLAAIFVNPPSPPTIVIAGLSNLILRWVNSQKCLMKIQ